MAIQKLHIFSRKWMLVTFAGVLLFLVVGNSHGEVLYGINLVEPPSPQLLRINPVTGAGELVADLADMIPIGLADSPDGRLFTFDLLTSRLIQLNPLDGQIVDAIDIGVNATNRGEGSLAFASDGTGYLALTVGNPTGTGDPNIPGELYSFDLNPNSAELLYGLIPNFDGMDISPTDIDLGMGLTLLEGSLVGLNQAAAKDIRYELWDLDINNIPPLLPPLKFADTGLIQDDEFPIPLAGLTFRSDGSLFSVIDDTLFRFDSGFNAIPVGSIGFPNVSGLTFLGNGSFFAPEPTSIAIWSLLGLGGVGYGFLRLGRNGK